MRRTTVYNRASYLPAEKLKEIRWSVSEDEEGHEILQTLAHGSQRAVYSRAMIELGMWHDAMALGRTDLARKLESRLHDHGIYPRESIIIKDEQKDSLRQSA